MTRAALALLLAAAALAPLPALAQSAPITATVDPARRALGYELATLLNSEPGTIAMIDRMLDDQMPTAMMADPNVKAMEAAHPGIVKAMIAAMKPILIRHMRAELPKLWDELAVFFASNMTEAELRAAIAFYRSPAGTKIIAIMETETDFGPMMADMARSGDYELKAEHLNDTAMTGATKIASALSRAEIDQVLAFMRTPAGRKIVALTPRMTAVVTEWANRPTPELDVQLGKAVSDVVYEFTGMRINL